MFIVKNFLSREHCSELISLAKNWQEMQYTPGVSDEFPVMVASVNVDQFEWAQKLSKGRKYFSHYVLKYEVGSFLPEHIDFNLEEPWVDVYNILLNDEFIGGELVFPLQNQVITNTDIGALISHPAGLTAGKLDPSCKHYVNKITSGVRYSLSLRF
jgi:hypothetical protein